MQIQLSRYVGPDAQLTASGLPEGADAFAFTKAVRKEKAPALFIARDDTRAAAFQSACRFFAPDIPVLMLPAWDCLPYDRVSPSQTLAARRAGALFFLTTINQNQPYIIVTTISAAIQNVPPRAIFSEAGLSAKVGEDMERERLIRYLTNNGYSRASTVVEAGEFAVRGGIVDIFPPTEKNPLRLDFFGDEIESIREFDIDSQRTTSARSELTLAPVSEVFMTEDSISHFRRNYIASFGGGVSRDPIYAAVIDGIRPQGIEHYMPLFYDHAETVFDYLSPRTLIALDGLLLEAMRERIDLIEDFYTSRREHAAARDTGSGDPSKNAGLYRPLPKDRLYLDERSWDECLSTQRIRNHTPFESPEEGVLDFGGRPARNFSAERRTEGVNVFEVAAEHISSLRQSGQRVWLGCWTDGSRERLVSVFEDQELIVPKVNSQAARDSKAGDIRAVILPVENGFTIGALTVLSEQDILGDRLINRGRKRKAKNFIAEAASLTPNDLIVHIDHGLGRYLGLRTLQVSDAPHDCLELEYAGGAKLYLPVENIELLSRYGSATDGAVLDRLGSAAWQARKSKAKGRLRDLAAGLIKIAAKRAMRKTDPINPDESTYNEFSARFPYAETDDQLNAIDDVYKDLAMGRPMDRLICGDVGFGKTEVALRAAFAVAMAGQQVAIIAPTTILSRQHFKTFSERFRGWPVNVRQLSRLVGAKEAKQNKEDLANGRVDIIIGTHALLAKTVKFSDLGLVIVDEEQRFGVQHKERLKSLRADVHVLTLTATPIPRTLQMALSGIRELSLIATPPVDRLAIRTYVTPWDEVSLRKALLREKYRGGPVLFCLSAYR